MADFAESVGLDTIDVTENCIDEENSSNKSPDTDDLDPVM